MQIDPPSSGGQNGAGDGIMGGADDGSSDDANTPLQSPKSQNTSREEDESSNANESDCKSPSQRLEGRPSTHHHHPGNRHKNIYETINQIKH